MASEILFFTAPWRKACLSVKAEIERLHLTVTEVDIDLNPDIQKKWNVQGLPTLMLTFDGKEHQREVGSTPCIRFARMLAEMG